MRIGRFIDLPNEYSRFARVKDPDGNTYTVDPDQLPKDADTETDYAYKVEIWGGGSGVAYNIKEDD